VIEKHSDDVKSNVKYIRPNVFYDVMCHASWDSVQEAELGALEGSIIFTL